MTHNAAGNYPGPLLIVGSGKNIGFHLARRLLDRGATLYLTYRSDAQAVDDLRAQYPEQVLETFVFDGSDSSSISEMFRAIREREEGLYGVIDTVGPFTRKPLEQTDPDVFGDLVQGNLVQAYHVAHHAYPLLKKRGGGRLVFFTFAGVEKLAAYSRIGAYAAAKTALLALVRSMAVEWADDGVSVNTLAPGLIRGTDEDQFPASMRDRNDRKTGLADIARAVEFLLDPENRKVTGVNLTVSGGFGW